MEGNSTVSACERNKEVLFAPSDLLCNPHACVRLSLYSQEIGGRADQNAILQHCLGSFLVAAPHGGSVLEHSVLPKSFSAILLMQVCQ